MEISLPVAIAISGRRNLGLEVEPSLELAYLKLSSSGFHLAVDSGTRTQLTKKKTITHEIHNKSYHRFKM